MEKGGKVWLRYERETKDPDRELNGRQELIFHWFGEAAGPISSSNTGIGLSCRLTGTARRRSGTWPGDQPVGALSLGTNARRSRVDTGDIVVAERNDMPKRAVAEEPGQKRM